jgi:multicomponent Na+:H+ antiporter subunit D
MSVLLVLPLLIPLATAAVSLLAWRRLVFQRWLAVASAASLLGAGGALIAEVYREGIQATQISNWPAPFGITLVADMLSALMVVLTGMTGLAVAVYALASLDAERERLGFYPLLHMLLMGVSGAFLTGDLFNLYVWFEVMLVASFVLLALGGERAQLEGAIKYVTLNLMSSAIFLAAVGLLYGMLGSLNLADLAEKLRTTAEPGLLTALAMLFLVAFGIKAAVFPLFFWLPASYHTPPVAVSAIFAGLLTKVGVYALIRVFTLLFVQEPHFTHTLILVISGLTMLSGVLGALAQNEFRRILAFHIISQIGYMIMGLALRSPLALAGSVFYIFHHIVVKTNLFLVSGAARRLSGTDELKRLGGLYRTRPGLALLFLVPALSLAGIPPLSGFWAKLTLIRAGLELEGWLIVPTALSVSLLTLVSMTKIWAEVFWKPTPPSEPPPLSDRLSPAYWLPMVALAAVTVAIGLLPEPLFVLSLRAAEQLLDPAAYIGAVLGDAP